MPTFGSGITYRALAEDVLLYMQDEMTGSTWGNGSFNIDQRLFHEHDLL